MRPIQMKGQKANVWLLTVGSGLVGFWTATLTINIGLEWMFVIATTAALAMTYLNSADRVWDHVHATMRVFIIALTVSISLTVLLGLLDLITITHLQVSLDVVVSAFYAFAYALLGRIMTAISERIDLYQV